MYEEWDCLQPARGDDAESILKSCLQQKLASLTTPFTVPIAQWALWRNRKSCFFFCFLLNPPGQFKACGYFFPLGESLCEDFLFLTVHSVKLFFFYCLLLENVGAEHKAFFAGQWMNSWPKHLTFECSFSKHCSSGGKSKLARLYRLSSCVLSAGIGIFSHLPGLSSVQMNLLSLFCIYQINILLKTGRWHHIYVCII